MLIPKLMPKLILRQYWKLTTYGLYLHILLVISGKGFAESGEANDKRVSDAKIAQPSAEFLEFLAEVDQEDEQTYELVLFHGLKDSKDNDSGAGKHE